MTDEQINIKIAELCGWGFKQRFLGEPYSTAPKEMTAKLDPAHWNRNLYELPNYTADLNAMHEAEKRLTDIDDRLLYDKALAETTSGFTYHATARHRAEAFLRVLGQWEEAP